MEGEGLMVKVLGFRIHYLGFRGYLVRVEVEGALVVAEAVPAHGAVHVQPHVVVRLLRHHILVPPVQGSGFRVWSFRGLGF